MFLYELENMLLKLYILSYVMMENAIHSSESVCSSSLYSVQMFKVFKIC